MEYEPSEFINSLPSQLQRPFHFSILAAQNSPGVGGKKSCFKVGAALYRKNKLISLGYNSNKTHPKLISYFKYPYQHAETSAILGAGDLCHNGIIFVARLMKCGKIGLAKPCNSCFKVIYDNNIKQVYYTTYDGVELYENS